LLPPPATGIAAKSQCCTPQKKPNKPTNTLSTFLIFLSSLFLTSFFFFLFSYIIFYLSHIQKVLLSLLCLPLEVLMLRHLHISVYFSLADVYTILASALQFLLSKVLSWVDFK
jgi:magnesium-transporting ATPase (P-type)